MPSLLLHIHSCPLVHAKSVLAFRCCSKSSPAHIDLSSRRASLSFPFRQSPPSFDTHTCFRTLFPSVAILAKVLCSTSHTRVHPDTRRAPTARTTTSPDPRPSGLHAKRRLSLLACPLQRKAPAPPLHPTIRCLLPRCIDQRRLFERTAARVGHTAPASRPPDPAGARADTGDHALLPPSLSVPQEHEWDATASVRAPCPPGGYYDNFYEVSG